MDNVKLTSEARVVFERHHSCDEKHGPAEFGRVGYAIGPEVTWVASYYYPGTSSDHYREAVDFAQAVTDRWNAGRSALNTPPVGLGKMGGEP